MKHPKLKGTIGVAKAIAKFNELSCNVFTEFGDLSKIDLIVEKNSKLYRIQVKSTKSSNGKVVLPLRKCAPGNYVYKYKRSDFDYFVLYISDLDKLLLIPSTVLNKCSNSFIVRINPSKNKQVKRIHLIKDYESFDIILRDFTSNS